VFAVLGLLTDIVPNYLSDDYKQPKCQIDGGYVNKINNVIVVFVCVTVT